MVRLTDCPDMTLDVYHRGKNTNTTTTTNDCPFFDHWTHTSLLFVGSVSSFRGSGERLQFIVFCTEILLSKTQSRPYSDAAFCSILTVSALFAYILKKG